MKNSIFYRLLISPCITLFKDEEAGWEPKVLIIGFCLFILTISTIGTIREGFSEHWLMESGTTAVYAAIYGAFLIILASTDDEIRHILQWVFMITFGIAALPLVLLCCAALLIILFWMSLDGNGRAWAWS